VVNPKTLPTSTNQKQLPTKAGQESNVLTRSSEFQQNRKEIQLRGTEIPRKKNKNSTPQKILSSKLAQNNFLQAEYVKSCSHNQIV
jgi:hypothetical protein